MRYTSLKQKPHDESDSEVSVRFRPQQNRTLSVLRLILSVLALCIAFAVGRLSSEWMEPVAQGIEIPWGKY